MSLTNHNILGLVDGCKQNNRESQQELYKLLYDYAYGVTYRYANDDQEANALVNDSFLKLFKNINICKLDKSNNMLNSFKGWFRKIIVNTCIDRYRSNKNTRQHESDTQSSIIDNSENGEDKLGYKEIINTVKQLSSAYRTVFNLHVIEGYSHEEIAQLLDISIGTSKSNLSKAKERLRTILQKKTNYNITYDAITGQRQ
ncbi:MAG: RNA polymerase sigma factor [Ferruginibacter sp.]